MLHSHILAGVYTVMRKMAKSNKYQLLYNQYKETGIRIFENEHYLTDFQITFLQYLTFYSSLYSDIYMGEVSDIVLEDDIYEEAYVYYKQKAGKEKSKERKKAYRTSSKSPISKKATTSNTHIVFSRPKLKSRG